MREQTTIPDWALEHIRQQLRPGEEVINAVSFKQGLFRGVVLLNTSRGAAIVAKTLIGEPQSALLTYPRDLVTFRCTACSARNILIDAEPPVDLHCSHCGAPHHVETGGAARAGRGEAAPPSKAGQPEKKRPKAAKKAGAKTQKVAKKAAAKVKKAGKKVAKKAPKRK